MKITEEIYEAAWVKRKLATASFKAQLDLDIAIAKSLPFGQQRIAAIKACERYDEACEPAIEEWQRDLGIIEK